MRKNLFSTDAMNLVFTTATAIATAFGGIIDRDDTHNAKTGAFWSDDEIKSHRDDIYMTRVRFADDLHNAVEVTVAATRYYITVGDIVDENIRDRVTANAVKIERRERWKLPNVATVDSSTLVALRDGLTATETPVKASEKPVKGKSTTKTRKTAHKASKTA